MDYVLSLIKEVAILYFLFYSVIIYCFGLLMFNTDIYRTWSEYFANKQMFRLIFYTPITIISVLPAFIITYIRGQKIRSLGLKRENIMKSIFLGILFGLPVLIPTIISGLMRGRSFISMKYLIWGFLYYLICIGFVEELIFRGFIQVRIRGLIKDKWKSIIIVGLMFSFMHVPFQMMNSDLSILKYIYTNIPDLIRLTIFHIYFVYIYTRDNNIIAPIIAHTIFNLSGSLFM